MHHQQISIPSPTHKDTHTLPPPSSPLKLANPAVVGLAGFALTTFVLQLHNLEVCGIGPVIALGLVFGGGCQLVAGLMEMVTGNGFGFAAFTGYGAFWIAFSILNLFKANNVYVVSDNEVGAFLIGYAIFTFVLFVGSLRRSKMEVALFSTLLIGLIFASIQKFTGNEGLHYAAAWTLMLCAFIAFYCWAHVLYVEVFGDDILPMGAPLWTGKVAWKK